MGKQKYDFICSLGGNCAAAHNLDCRELRLFSLPFDWTYITSDQPLYQLPEGLKNGFKNFFKKENLRPLSKEEYNTAHADRAQYKDIHSGFYYVNHFRKDIPFDVEYESVKQKMDRRFARFMDKITQANSILFVLSACFEVKTEVLIFLLNELKGLYPHKHIQIVALLFKSPKGEHISLPGLEIFHITREMHTYDFTKTNWEWAFLDDVELSSYPHPGLLKRCLIKLIPCRKLRHKLKKKYYIR